MKTDIEIAQEATLLPIKEVAANIGIKEDDLELYGKYKAKFDSHFMDEVKNNEDGKLVLVTAIIPGVKQPWKENNLCSSCAISWTMFWYQRWSSRWRICTGCTNGRFKPSFYRGFSCDHICKQLISSNA